MNDFVTNLCVGLLAFCVVPFLTILLLKGEWKRKYISVLSRLIVYGGMATGITMYALSAF